MKARCPNCGTTFPVPDPEVAPDFPFCSRRCRMADLDRWFTDEYAIPGDEDETGLPGDGAGAEP